MAERLPADDSGGRVEKLFPAYDGAEPYVFVCYSHEDAEVVYPELAWLRDQGINVWYDEGIPAGRNWREVVGDSLLGARHLLFYISDRSLRSDHCNREVGLALDEGKDIVPVYLRSVELTSDLKIGLNRVQALDREHDAHYRQHLLDALRAVAGASRASRRNDAAQSTPRTSAIAVLPFTNLSNDPEQEFFSDGIAEDILNELAKNPDLTVRPRSSSFSLKGARLDLPTMAARLNVTHLLEGSVRRAGDRIRVTVQLSDVVDNRSVWSERFDRDLTDVFAVQDEIAREILTALNARLGARASPRTFAGTDAYNAFLRGRDCFNRADLGRARAYLRTATELDASNADAWELRAEIRAYLAASGFTSNAGEDRARRRAFLNKALAIDSNHPDAQAQRAYMDTHCVDRDYQTAVNELVRLVTAHPNNEQVHAHLSFALSSIGRMDLSRRVVARLFALSPLSALANSERVQSLLEDGAIQDARAALAHYPRLGIEHGEEAAYLAIATRDAAALREIVDRGTQMGPFHHAYAALVPHLQGDFDFARKKIAQLKNVEGYQSFLLKHFMALIEGDVEAALAFYYEAVDAAEPVALNWVQGKPEWRGLFPGFFESSGYQQMLRHFGLDPVSTNRIVVPELPF
jgi:adenylate cyclase